MTLAASEREKLFWDLAEALDSDPVFTRSTMFWVPVPANRRQVFACPEHGTGNLVVKLAAERVSELIATGAGIPLAPNRKVFREWVAIPVADIQEWTALLGEAKAFAHG
jgi:hypothetical protein